MYYLLSEPHVLVFIFLALYVLYFQLRLLSSFLLVETLLLTRFEACTSGSLIGVMPDHYSIPVLCGLYGVRFDPIQKRFSFSLGLYCIMRYS